MIKCEICGAMFNPANLVSVLAHMHDDLDISMAIGIKGHRTDQPWPEFPPPPADHIQ